jgi:hypothetical protein
VDTCCIDKTDLAELIVAIKTTYLDTAVAYTILKAFICSSPRSS